MQLSRRTVYRIWLILSITLIASLVLGLSFIHPSTVNAARAISPAATYPPIGSNDLTYHNGPVIHNPDAKLIFEGTWQNSDMQRIKNYFADASGSSFESILTQYYDTTGHIANTISVSGSVMDPNFLHSHWCGNSANSVIDTGLATNPAGVPNDVYDEIQAQILANHWSTSSIFFVYTPPGYDVLWQSCQNAPCGYHSQFTTTGGLTNWIYAVIPYAGGPCGTTDGNAVDTAINVTSHEQFEAITNPTYTIFQQSGGGWYNSDCGSQCEIGDKCGGTWPGITLNGHLYAGVQFEYSNAVHTCTDAYSPPPPPTPTPPPNSCRSHPNDTNCDNQDYIQQGCNAYPQLQVYNSSILNVTLYYSTNCQSNWTSGKIQTSGYTIVKEDIEREATLQEPALTFTETVNNTSWYTNMVWAPNSPARGCAWYKNSSGAVSGPFCTPWSPIAASCKNSPSDSNCDNQDYVVQGCNDYPQTSPPPVDNSYVTITVHYSTNCQSNWAVAKLDQQSSLFIIDRVTINRAAVSGGDGAASYSSTNSQNNASWWSPMVWAPSNPVQGCVLWTNAQTYHTYTTCTNFQ